MINCPGEILLITSVSSLEDDVKSCLSCTHLCFHQVLASGDINRGIHCTTTLVLGDDQDLTLCCSLGMADSYSNRAILNACYKEVVCMGICINDIVLRYLKDKAIWRVLATFLQSYQGGCNSLLCWAINYGYCFRWFYIYVFNDFYGSDGNVQRILPCIRMCHSDCSLTRLQSS